MSLLFSLAVVVRCLVTSFASLAHSFAWLHRYNKGMIFSRSVKIPEGSSWLCWQGCPQGVLPVASVRQESHVASSADVSAVDNRSPFVSPREFEFGARSLRGMIRRRLTDSNAAEGAQSFERASLKGNSERLVGAAGSVVVVHGVELHEVPLWLRFGSIVPTSSLFSTHTLASELRSTSGTVAAPDPEHHTRQEASSISFCSRSNIRDRSATGCSHTPETRRRSTFSSLYSSRENGNSSSSSADDDGFRFEVATAEEALQAPVDLLVMLGKPSGGVSPAGRFSVLCSAELVHRVLDLLGLDPRKYISR